MATMTAATDNSGAMDLRDLGIPRIAVLGASGALGALPGLTAALFSVPLIPVLAVTGAGILGGIAISFLVARRLRGSLHEPVESILRAMDQLRMSGQAGRIAEDGAPLLQPLLRRFNMAGSALEQRSRQSLNNLMNAEAAFDRVNAVLQSLREGVVVVDTQGRIVLANRNARRMLQLGDRHLESEALVALLKGELQRSMQDGLRRLEQEDLDELRIGDVPHDSRIYDLAIVQVQSPRPEQDYGKVVVLADVTHNQEVNRLKDELLSSISHELRTPLTNMVSSSEILTSLTPQDEAEWREFALMLNSESRRLKVLVDDIMEYGLLETGRVEWNREPTDVAVIARTAADVLRVPAQLKSIALEIDAPLGAFADVDARRCNEAICRILDNAVKFTPNNGRVQIAVHRVLASIEITIADNGRGIAPEDRERVFERFIQLGDFMTEKPQGAGLGLAIVQRIVEALGGSVRCEASPSGGALFRIAVPASKLVKV